MYIYDYEKPQGRITNKNVASGDSSICAQRGQNTGTTDAILVYPYLRGLESSDILNHEVSKPVSSRIRLDPLIYQYALILLTGPKKPIFEKYVLRVCLYGENGHLPGQTAALGDMQRAFKKIYFHQLPQL